MNEKLSSNLDTLETSGDSRPPESYRKYCITHCQDEYQASLDAYADFDLEDGKSRVVTLEQCRTGAYFVRNRKTAKVKVLSSSCHLRWCPMCSATRRWFLTQQVSDWLTTVRQQKFLTLTVQHYEEPLQKQIDFLYESFKKFRKTKFIKNHVRGGIWFFQIHRAKSDGLWHPHLHCVIDAAWMDKFKISATWEFVTKTSKIINIKEVKNADSMAEYVARYAARPSLLSHLDVPSRYELLQALHGRRLVGTWGNARSITLRPSKPPDADDWVKVGYYRKVIWTMDTDPRARSIWTAFKNDTELSEDCNILDNTDKTCKHKLDWKQLVLDPEWLFLGFY